MIDFDSRLREGLRALAESGILDVPETGAHTDTTGGGGKWVRSAVLAAAAALVLVGVVAVVRRTDRHANEAHEAVSLVEVAPPPLSARVGAAVASTTHGLVVWGGRRPGDVGITTGPSSSTQYFADGAALATGAASWRPLATAPLSARSDVVTAYDGRDRVVLVGGYGAGGNATDGAELNLVTGAWTHLANTPSCAKSADWSTSTLFVLTQCDPDTAGLAVFDPARRTWTELPSIPGGVVGGVVMLRGRPAVWWPDGSYRSLSPDGRSWSVRVPLLGEPYRRPAGIIPVRRHGRTDLMLQFAGAGPETVVASFVTFDRVWRVESRFPLNDQASNDAVLQPVGFDDLAPYYSQLGIAWMDPGSGDQSTFPFTDKKWAEVRLATARGVDPMIVATEVSAGNVRMRAFRLQRR